MCDFRDPPKVKNKETGEISEIYHGHIGIDYDRAKEPGIYHIGATGCGYGYYDGKNWLSCYSDNRYYEFIFDESKKLNILNNVTLFQWDEEYR